MQNQASPEFLRPKEVCRYIGIGRTKLHLLTENDPDFPPKIRLSKRCVGFRKSGLDDWLAKKEKQAKQGSGGRR